MFELSKINAKVCTALLRLEGEILKDQPWPYATLASASITYLELADIRTLCWKVGKLINEDAAIPAEKVKILTDALEDLSAPCTRADYTIGRLDEITCKIASDALKKFREQIG